MRTAKASINDWKSIQQTSLHAIKIREICKTLPVNDMMIFQKVDDQSL
jgi:hypothetical protein